MKKVLKKVAVVLVVVFIGIQFIPTSKNQSTTKLPTDFTTIYDVPNNIKIILKKSCYDCHSNNTRYPWYNKIQPVAWFLENHINEAKEELNFSEFGSYSIKKRNHKIDEIIEEVNENKMPLKTYTLMHKNAKLSKLEKEEFSSWFDSLIIKR